MCVTRQREGARLKPEDIGGIEAWPALRRAKTISSSISFAAATPFLGWTALHSPGSHSMSGQCGSGAFPAVAVLDQGQSECVGTQCVLPDGF